MKIQRLVQWQYSAVCVLSLELTCLKIGVSTKIGVFKDVAPWKLLIFG